MRVRKGLYLLNEVIYEIQNGRQVPIGVGYYKAESTPKFGSTEQKIRLGALYNNRSIGPKEIKPIDLPKYLLHIQLLQELPNEDKPESPFCQVIWDAIIDEDHQDMLDLHSAINADFILQEQEQKEFEDGFLIDEYNLSLQEKEVADGLFLDDQCKHESESQDSIIYPDTPEEY